MGTQNKTLIEASEPLPGPVFIMDCAAICAGMILVLALTVAVVAGWWTGPLSDAADAATTAKLEAEAHTRKRAVLLSYPCDATVKHLTLSGRTLHEGCYGRKGAK